MGAVRFDIPGGYDYHLSPYDDFVGPVVLPFTFFGFNACWPKNNGTIGLDNNVLDYVPYSFGTENLLSPYWTDIAVQDDPLLLASVTYGFGVVEGLQSFICTWSNVGRYPFDYSVRDTFQAIISPGRVEYNYDQLQFASGRASWMGARVGFILPTWGVSELPGSGTNATVDSGITPLTGSSQGSPVLGRYVWPSVAPVYPMRQKQRNDGLGRSAGRGRGGSSRQSSGRGRGYL